MAIDTKAKRASTIGISAYFTVPAVVPDGTIAKFDRQVAGYGYGGIAAGAAAPLGTPPWWVEQQGWYVPGAATGEMFTPGATAGELNNA